MIFIAGGIFIFTLVLVIWQPKGLNVGWSATLGALLALIAGVVGIRDVGTVTDMVWNATLAFVAVVLISLILDEIGFFEWAALHMTMRAKGNGMRMFIYMVVLGSLVSALFTNDGGILILTPIVLAVVRMLHFDNRTILAFIFACGFIADTTSLPFTVSNLVNILSADAFDIDFVRYASRMLVPDLFSLAASLAVLFVVFRKSIPRIYETSDLKHPREALRDPFLFKLSWYILGLLLAGYVLSEFMDVPVSVIAGMAAAGFLLAAGIRKSVDPKKIVREAPWSVIIFSIGMYVVVYGLKNAGITAMLTEIIGGTPRWGLYGAVTGTGMIAALLSSVMNNLPAVFICALSIQDTQTHDVIREGLVYANIIGSDLGPKMTPIGSLATLLWLHVLGKKGIKITWGEYFKTGIVLTIPTLLVTLAGLYIWLLIIS